MRDPYTVLGVSKNTSSADLKKTYRKLAMKLHPDQNPGDEQVAEKFKEVSAAYALLSDEKMKARYDRGEIQGLAGTAGGASGDALIEVHINKHPYYTIKNNNIYMDLPITLKEAVLGGKVTVPTISGKIALNIPKNSSSGKIMRLKEKGAIDTKTKKKGDQLVKLMVMLPDEIDDDLEKSIKKWSSKLKSDNAKNIRKHLE